MGGSGTGTYTFFGSNVMKMSTVCGGCGTVGLDPDKVAMPRATVRNISQRLSFPSCGRQSAYQLLERHAGTCRIESERWKLKMQSKFVLRIVYCLLSECTTQQASSYIATSNR